MPDRPEPTPAEQFQRWMQADDAPATRVYWTGLLAEDAATDREARELAKAVLFASGALPHTHRTGRNRSGTCIQPPAGPALVELSQRRLGEGLYEYRARKLSRRREAACPTGHREDPTR